jgi:hypothetical protein
MNQFLSDPTMFEKWMVMLLAGSAIYWLSIIKNRKKEMNLNIEAPIIPMAKKWRQAVYVPADFQSTTFQNPGRPYADPGKKFVSNWSESYITYKHRTVTFKANVVRKGGMPKAFYSYKATPVDFNKPGAMTIHGNSGDLL